MRLYVHISIHIRGKPEDKGKKGIFVSYNQVTKGYKLYNPVTKKLVIGRNVAFDEDATWDWSREEKRKLFLI